MSIPEAGRYSSHGFRRGTTQEMKESGAPWSVVATCGVWRSSAFRGYVDLSRDVETVAHHLFEVGFDSDSADEYAASAIGYNLDGVCGKPMAGRPGRCSLGIGFPDPIPKSLRGGRWGSS